jgi:hypothetical protein
VTDEVQVKNSKIKELPKLKNTFFLPSISPIKMDKRK